jgi:hypothetical protein
VSQAGNAEPVPVKPLDGHRGSLIDLTQVARFMAVMSSAAKRPLQPASRLAHPNPRCVRRGCNCAGIPYGKQVARGIKEDGQTLAAAANH